MTQQIWHAIGLMSGTSLDGVDLVFVKFTCDKGYHFKILKTKTVKYSESWKKKLQAAYNDNAENISDLSVYYGILLAQFINDFIAGNNIETLDFIASHGHTIFHKPEQAYTLQIGDGQTIANLTKQTVVCDFRTQDVKLGGQGAPLVPVGDALLFNNYDYCLNLGGFSNISFDENGTRKAYDVCPVNIVLNHFAQQLDLAFDDKGTIASKGKVNVALLKELNSLPFYKKAAPKSLGFEFVSTELFPIFDTYNLPIADLLRTFTEHIAQQLASNLKPKTKVLVTGGGAYNQFLIQRLKVLAIVELVLPDNAIIDFKEALIFALLGLLKLQNKVNCLQSVTGASKDHSSGVVFRN